MATSWTLSLVVLALPRILCPRFFMFNHVHRVSLSVSSERAAGEKTRSNIILHSHILVSITFIVFVVTSSIFHLRLGNEGEPDNEPGQRMFVVPGNV
jgi:hypothetical protein